MSHVSVVARIVDYSEDSVRAGGVGSRYPEFFAEIDDLMSNLKDLRILFSNMNDLDDLMVHSPAISKLMDANLR